MDDILTGCLKWINVAFAWLIIVGITYLGFEMNSMVNSMTWLTGDHIPKEYGGFAALLIACILALLICGPIAILISIRREVIIIRQSLVGEIDNVDDSI